MWNVLPDLVVQPNSFFDGVTSFDATTNGFGGGGSEQMSSSAKTGRAMTSTCNPQTGGFAIATV